MNKDEDSGAKVDDEFKPAEKVVPSASNQVV